MPAPYIQANTNGRLHSAHEPSITPLSRGFLYGDAIYEVWRTYHGTVFTWHEHFDRLEASARALHLEIPWSRDAIFGEVRKTVAAFRTATGFAGELYIRLQVSRGAGPIGLDPALADHPEYVILVQPCPLLSDEKMAAGLTLSIARNLRRNPTEALSPAWKTGNYLNNILCLREARARGADDVVILNLRGEITEAATLNLGFVRGGEVLTPPLDAGILSGITRRLLIDKVGPAAGAPVRETVLRESDLATMDECFLISTTRDITPVVAVDQLRFKVGPGTVGWKLKAAFAQYFRDYVAAHPELKL